MAKHVPKFVIRARKGRPVPVDQQIVDWRKEGGPAKLRKALLDGRGLTEDDLKPKVRPRIYNPFGSD